MSLATLKKKTNAKYNNASVGNTGFSLNGTHRNQGYVGQTSLSRTIIGTPMRGNVARGHGGCCGTYNTNMVKPSLCGLEDSKIVKSSVLSSKGMLRLKHKWANRGGEYAPVKPDSNNNNNFSSMYTSYKRREVLNNITRNCPSVVGVISDCTINSNGQPSTSVKDCSKITKPKEMYSNIDQSEYIFRKTSECIANDPMQLVSSNSNNPFRGMGSTTIHNDYAS